MNFEKIKWWCKAQKKIKGGVWYYPNLENVTVFEQRQNPIYDKPVSFITRAHIKQVMKYKQYCGSYQNNKECLESAYKKTQDTLTRCKNLGAVVTTLTFDQFYSFWSINPYRWHCRDLFAYTKNEENGRMFIQFKTKTDLLLYIGWREEIRETYEK